MFRDCKVLIQYVLKPFVDHIFLLGNVFAMEVNAWYATVFRWYVSKMPEPIALVNC